MLYAAGGSGKRVYVDYVKLTTQGATQTPVSISGYPASVGNVLSSTIESLTPNTTYYYTVTPQGNSVAVSNQIQVTTALNDGVSNLSNFNLSWIVLSDGIQIRNLQPNTQLRVYDFTGKSLEMIHSNSSEVKILLQSKGIYIVKVRENQKISSFKVIY